MQKFETNIIYSLLTTGVIESTKNDSHFTVTLLNIIVLFFKKL